MDERVLRAVRPDRPNPVDVPPLPLMAVHQQPGVVRRKLQMIEPVRPEEEVRRLARPQVDRVDPHGKAGREPGRHHLALVDRLVEIVDLQGARTAVILPVAHDEGAARQRLVRVDGEDLPAARQIGELALGSGRQIGAPERAVVRIGRASREEHGRRPVADGNDLHGPLDNDPGGEGREIDDPDVAAPGRVDHLLAVGRVAVVVEIQAGRPGLARDAVDAVPRVGIDPGLRRLAAIRRAGFGPDKSGKGRSPGERGEDGKCAEGAKRRGGDHWE